MTNSQRLATVRASFLAWLQAESDDASTDPSDCEILRESILIRDEFYCGRRFYTASAQAVWFIEQDELKIYHGNGQLACVLAGEQIDTFIDEADSAPEPTILKLPLDVDSDQSDERRRAA